MVSIFIVINGSKGINNFKACLFLIVITTFCFEKGANGDHCKCLQLTLCNRKVRALRPYIPERGRERVLPAVG